MNTPNDQPEKQPITNHAALPVVALGASAGGLDAIVQLLSVLTADTGMAYVIIQHLAPTHESMLSSILGKHTKMTVQEVTDRVLVEPNVVYIIPPGKDMEIIDGHLTLAPRTAKLNMPIDKFFISLAEVKGSDAIGIVLSGAATDGTAGLKAIREAGGLTIVQDDSAKFQSMPKSAIAEGVVDLVLRPEDIAKELIKISRNPFARKSLDDAGEEKDNNDEEVQHIFKQLKEYAGVNFNFYKETSVYRRMIRRMLIINLQSFKDYNNYLKEHREELNLLYDDLLINVTRFFREPETNEYVSSTLLPHILKNKKNNEPIRIWVPACAAGQEVYSLAMLLLETTNTHKQKPVIQIFGSDLSENCIKKARIGVYSKNEVDNIPPPLLTRYFDAIDVGYRVKKTIKELCLFTRHNVLTDPPFSRLDLISCCNFLIYLKAEGQHKVIHTFHYALQNDGYLVLGKSETIGNATKYFKYVGNEFKANIYIKEFYKRALLLNQTFLNDNLRVQDSEEKQKINSIPGAAPLNLAVDHLLLTQFIPSNVVINKEMEILQFRGSTSLYLEPAQGAASFNLLKMARTGLKVELRNAVFKSMRSGQAAKKEGLEFKFQDVSYKCDIEVVPLHIVPDEKYYLVLFKNTPASALSEPATNKRKSGREKELEKELLVIKEDMTTIIEEREGAIEELQTANEEIISTNEELQTINEELHTSKEEMESTNEELATINDQLMLRNEQLNELQNYTDGIVATIAEAMIVLDKNLVVRSANQSFYALFKTSPEETEGFYLFDLGNGQWKIPRLKELLLQVIPQRNEIYNFKVTHEFPRIGNKIMMLNAKLLSQKIHSQELIFLAIQDITAHVEAEKIIREREEWFNNMANNAPVMIWVAGKDKTITFFNNTWYAFTGNTASENVENDWMKAIQKEDVERYLTAYNESFDSQQPFTIEYRLKRYDSVYRWVLNQGKPTYDGSSNFTGYIGTCTDIDDQKKIAEKKDEFITIASHELKTPLTTAKAYVQLLEDLLKENGNEEIITFLHKTKVSIEKLNQLIGQLLDTTKLQNGKMTLNITEFNFEDLFIETIDFIRASHPKYNITATGNAGTTIHADYERLQQVITNLLTNAVKYSQSSEKIEIHVGDSNDELLFSVRDHGVGIHPNNQKNIFEKYYREAEKTTHYPGLGVGLFIAAEIIERHHGRIWVESMVGEGSTFYFTIPLKRSSGD
ncbi:PAS domain S-box protein [Ilyomonas limi]|uniref:PAS domain S-box protein n=1 Tax=Ilyomonas limi TaxID=2575867 RepID=A0A4U3L0I9_9BACT|nr:chemotaxis protein CheB [Ilyomonas limi]TKK66986.1 PAS domain S-box protein [Ilyomonas limi]